MVAKTKRNSLFFNVEPRGTLGLGQFDHMSILKYRAVGKPTFGLYLRSLAGVQVRVRLLLVRGQFRFVKSPLGPMISRIRRLHIYCVKAENKGS